MDKADNETMHFVMLVFIFGVVNLGLGFGLAMYLNRTAPLWWENWDTLRLLLRFRNANQDRTEQQPEPIDAPAAPGTSRAVPSAETPAEIEKDEPPPADQRLQELKRALDLATRKLEGLAKQLKNPDGLGFNSSPWRFVAELQELCQPYMEQLNRSLDKLTGEEGEHDGGGAADGLIQKLLLDLVAQLETTFSNMQYMDFESGFSEAIDRISSETRKNLALTKALRDTVEAELAKDPTF